jgi:hypothetical protein
MALGLSGSFGAAAAQQALRQLQADRIAEEQRAIENAQTQTENDFRLRQLANMEAGTDIQRQELGLKLRPVARNPIINRGMVGAGGQKVTQFVNPDDLKVLSEQPEFVDPEKPEKPPALTELEKFMAASPEEQKRMLKAHQEWTASGRAPSGGGEDQGFVPSADPNAPHGDAYLKSLNPQQAAMVKALAEGRQPWPSSFALKTPYWQKLMNDVFQYDPTFDTATASSNARMKVRTDFTSGTSAKQVNALNTVIGHFGTLSDQAEKLDNTRFPLINTARNAVRSATGSPAVTNFDTTKEAVASELVRVWRQAGGASQDVQDWKATITSSQSPAQLRANLATIGQLLESKLEALLEQQRQGMGTAEIRLITPESRSALDKLEGKQSPALAPRGGFTLSPMQPVGSRQPLGAAPPTVIRYDEFGRKIGG